VQFSGDSQGTEIRESAAPAPVPIVTLPEQFAISPPLGANAVESSEDRQVIWAALGAPCSIGGVDPIVQYDADAGRWMLSQSLKTVPFHECIAVSTTADPAGSYALYSYDFGSYESDWPKFGVWPTARNSAYLASYNLFANAQRFSGVAMCAYDREAMLAGGRTANQICFTNNNNTQSYLPSDLDGVIEPPTGSAGYFLSLGIDLNARVNLFESLTLFRLAPDFASPDESHLTGPTTVPVQPFSVACAGGACIPQPNTRDQLTALGDRLMFRVAYRNFGDHESLVVNHATTAGAGVGIRWYELRTRGDGVDIVKQGTFAPDSASRWMGGIATDKAGDIGLAYNISSSSIHPSIGFTAQYPGDPANSMRPEQLLLAGSGSQIGGASKWSDASAIRVDPFDGCTFWYTTQYLKTDGKFNWSTDIASFSFPRCTGRGDDDQGADSSAGGRFTR
jgi:hypothetical protein